MFTTEGDHDPVIPFTDVGGNTGAAVPAQIFMAVPKSNEGSTIGFTVTVNLAGAIHCPGKTSGVNVYTAEVWLLTTEGVQVPLIPLSDMLGRVGTVSPAQMVKAVPILNCGKVFGLTVTENVAVVAHWPAAGVNVYTPEVWLLTDEGLHVPVMPLSDADGKAGNPPPWQMVNAVPKLNAGVVFELTVTVSMVDVAHWPAEGVNV